MANPIITFTERLKSSIGTQDTRSASKSIELISQYFDDRISQNEAGNWIRSLFRNVQSEAKDFTYEHSI